MINLETIAIINNHKRNHPNDAVTIASGDCPQCGPAKPIRSYLEATQCGACGWIIKDPEPAEKICGVCGQVLDREEEPLSKDCGGDCLNCVQDAEGSNGN